MKIVHKHVNKALKLRHHKHTGKILAHKHTSYRVLFALLLLPMFAIPLVDSLSAYADEVLSVTATIHAPIPAGNPTIDSPVDGAITSSGTVTVSGTCPVISPAIIVAVYRNLLLAGSAQCDVGGEYSVPISLEPGQNKLMATVVTITNGTGGSSGELMITYAKSVLPVSPVAPIIPQGPIVSDQNQVEGFDQITSPLQVLAKDIYVLVGPNGRGVWRGSFAGGTVPYEVTFDWGDGTIERRTVQDMNEQTFTHDYGNVQTRAITVSVVDANGVAMTLRSAAVTPDVVSGGLTIDRKAGTSELPPFITFIQKNAMTIYASTFFALLFLWYIERGRHILPIGQWMARLFHRPVHR